MIVLKNVVKSYGNLEVLKGINLTIQRGEVLSIMGASGAGKTTLLQILGTLDTVDRGDVLFLDENIAEYSSKKLSKFRNKNIGFIFQFHHLLPEFTALENVCMPAWIAGIDKKQAEKKALDLLKRLGIGSKSDKKPNEMSGGEQQRVAVARALINDPQIILADEPSGNLDSQNALALHELFMELKEEFNQTFVVVTHNKELSLISDRVLFMKDGIFE
ncbi:MAG: ABC transporter ATP-binding protein [Flavobacteriales bacterium]